MINSPWAVLLCKFKDDDSEPYERQRYNDLFTSSGAGKLNMVDFFRDMSHGALDLSGSRVFGWYTLDKNRSDYLADSRKPGLTVKQFGEAITKGRNELIGWARAAASADMAKYGQFFSVVVCMNVPTDLFGGGNGVVCDDGRGVNGMSSLSPSLLGQEMGHTYGLSHSMAYGSTADYADPWDVMSTANARMAPHPFFKELDVRANPVFLVGPGLNAANMWGRGWLDASRVWSGDSHAQVNTLVKLRPLHRRDLPGFLAIRFHDYFVEFRTGGGWDAAVTPTVLVHRFVDNRSYIVSDSEGRQAFGVGSFIGTPGNMSVLGSNFRIEVIDIDGDQQTARVRLQYTPPELPESVRKWPYRTPEVAWYDLPGNGDALVVVEGRATLIPRSSSFFRTLEQIALYESSAAIGSTQLQSAVREEALATIAAVTQEQLNTLQSFQQPAPPARAETYKKKQPCADD